MRSIASATDCAFLIAGKRERKAPVMAPRRFPMKIQFATTEAHAAALETLAANSLLDQSDHLRQALDWYLQQMGALRPRQMMNGQGADEHAPADHRT